METLQHKFVEFIPEVLENGVLYITVQYRTAVHSCACGCGGKVVTPFSPSDWEMTFNGREVTLYPSIGNWGFDCKSHYFIVKSRVQFLPRRVNKKRIPEGKKKNRFGFFRFLI